MITVFGAAKRIISICSHRTEVARCEAPFVREVCCRPAERMPLVPAPHNNQSAKPKQIQRLAHDTVSGQEFELGTFPSVKGFVKAFVFQVSIFAFYFCF